MIFARTYAAEWSMPPFRPPLTTLTPLYPPASGGRAPNPPSPPCQGGRGTAPLSGGRGTAPLSGGRGTAPLSGGRGTAPLSGGRLSGFGNPSHRGSLLQCYKHVAPLGLKTSRLLSRLVMLKAGWGTQPLRIPPFPCLPAPMSLMSLRWG